MATLFTGTNETIQSFDNANDAQSSSLSDFGGGIGSVIFINGIGVYYVTVYNEIPEEGDLILNDKSAILRVEKKQTIFMDDDGRINAINIPAGGSSNLAGVLAEGNSSGPNDINMNAGQTVNIDGNPVFSTADTIGVLNGGTGLSTLPTDGQLLTGKSGGAGYDLSTLNPVAEQTTVTNGDGTIEIGTVQNISSTSSPTFSSVTANSAPTADSDLTRKDYVDMAIQGSNWKVAALVATTGNIALSGEQTIDGVLTSSSRVLVWQQTDAAQNGIYVSDAGAWSRSEDADTGEELVNATVPVTSGSTYDNETFKCTNDTITIGVTNIVFTTLASTTSHNGLSNLQGGSTGEYYHLTATEHASVTGVTSAEYAQIQNIDSTTISNTQWGYVGSSNQETNTTSSPTFADLTLTSPLSTANGGTGTSKADPGIGEIPIGGSMGVPPAWVAPTGTIDQVLIELESNSLTFSLPQSISPTSDVTFNDITASSLLAPSGQSINITASGAGDILMNTESLVVDSSSGRLGFGTQFPLGYTEFNYPNSSTVAFARFSSQDAAALANAQVFVEFGIQIGNEHPYKIGLLSSSNTDFSIATENASEIVLATNGNEALRVDVNQDIVLANALGTTEGGTGATNETDARSNLGLSIGSDVQGWTQEIQDISELSPSSDNFIAGNGANWVQLDPSQSREALSLSSTDPVTFGEVDAGRFISGTGVINSGGPGITSYDVSDKNLIFIDTTSGILTLNTFSNGVNGQTVRIAMTATSGNTFQIVHNGFAAGQKIFLKGSVNYAITNNFGGIVLACDGTAWYEVSRS